jgi:repressor LexA
MTLCERCASEITRAARPPLTRRQHEVLTFVRDYIGAHGYAPTLEEIATARGYRSLSTVYEHLHNLERKGYLARRFNEERSLALVGVTP